jgi:hypothetical protein
MERGTVKSLRGRLCLQSEVAQHTKHRRGQQTFLKKDMIDFCPSAATAGVLGMMQLELMTATATKILKSPLIPSSHMDEGHWREEWKKNERRKNRASKSHTHPSHSQTSRLLTSSLSLGLPVPRPTQCVRGV